MVDVHADTLCGSCAHSFSEHPECDELTATSGHVVGGPWWACRHSEGGVDCMCCDFAMPGTIMNIGMIGTDPGDSENN